MLSLSHKTVLCHDKAVLQALSLSPIYNYLMPLSSRVRRVKRPLYAMPSFVNIYLIMHFCFNKMQTWTLMPSVLPFDESPLCQDSLWYLWKHREHLRLWPVLRWRCLNPVYWSIANNKAAHSDEECKIGSYLCNLLNCCSCPFIIINQRAAGPKEQFRALQSSTLLSL